MWIRGLLLTALLAARASYAGDDPCTSWPSWERFKELYLSEDGRVIDASSPQQITVSEGQAYALMFALIGNDPPAFARILQWTENNLTQGSLERALPAWRWGRGDDGTWRVLDPNSAADADLWMAYALTQAGPLWREPAYSRRGRNLSDRVLNEEVALVPGLGPTLLPAPQGFVADQTWRLNASYMPIEVLRGLRQASGNRRWDDVVKSSLQVIQASAPHGFAADWIRYRQPEGFITDALTHGMGGYDAIRVYLWAGMLPGNDPIAKVLEHQLAPMAALAAKRSTPPETIDTGSLENTGSGPPGFSAALLPLLMRSGQPGVASAYRARVDAETLHSNQRYYSDALSLFALGWVEGRYHFDASGELRAGWTSLCRAR